MRQRYFFDTSAFLAIIRGEAEKPSIQALNARLQARQCATSVLVIYELMRGAPSPSARGGAQVHLIGELTDRMTAKPITRAHGLKAAELFRKGYTRGAVDPLIAAQCLEGGFHLVTTNRQDFERVPGLQLVEL